MPVLGFRRLYGGCVIHDSDVPRLPDGIDAKLVKIEVPLSCDCMSGRLCLRSRRNRYDGIKICLQLSLKLAKEGKYECREIDMFEHSPIETMLTSSGSFSGHQKLDFILNFPKDQIFPDPFIGSSGSLSYKLVALMSQDGKYTWNKIAQHYLLDFKGFSNLSGLEVHPSVDNKLFLNGKITSIFTINKPVLLVGRDTSLKATLQLEGVFAYQVDVAMTLLRRKQIRDIVETEIISQQEQHDQFHEPGITLEWSLDFPLISTVTYANELKPMYSVRYFLKYQASFKQLGDNSCHRCCVGYGDSIVEVKVGTAFDNSFDPIEIIEDIRDLRLEYKSIVKSMLSLPPAYSDLSSTQESLLCLETEPPMYWTL